MAPLLPRADLAAAGIPASAVRGLVSALDGLDSVHSLMLLRHGEVLAEGWWAPYRPELPHVMFSVSKSFTATAVGLAISEGRFGLDDAVVDLLPDEVPAEPSGLLGRMRVRDLLTMTTGHADDSVQLARNEAGSDWVRGILAMPVEFEPGTHFVYDSGATHLLSAIVQRTSGERLLDYLTPRLFAPLGIEGGTWEQSPTGIDAGGWGLSITTEHLAAFGQLLLQRGEWHGAQLVPADWIDQATARQVPNDGPDRAHENPDWTQGYGFQFWRCRHGAYRGDGAFGQFVLVLPEHDAVLAITSGLEDMQAVLDAVWAHLLPALEAGGPVDPDPAADAALAATLSGLRMPTVAGEATPTGAGAGLLGAAFDIDGGALGIRSLRLDPAGGDGWTLTIGTADGEHPLPVGSGSWAAGSTALFGAPGPVATSGAWSGGTFTATLVSTVAPFTLTVELAPDGDGLVARLRLNVSFGDPDLGTLRGVRRG